MIGEIEIAVIGAGPAGMAAASEAARAGLRVALLDEQPAPGGQIYRAIERASATRRHILGPDYAAGAALVAEFRASGAEYLPDALVWNIGTDHLIDYTRGGATCCLRAGVIVAATGALERPCPVPGWTLPGVTTVGGLQILLKGAGVVEEGAVLAGAGPLLWLLAAQLVEAGAPPRAVVETSPRGRLTAALRHLPRALQAQAYLRQGRALIAAVRNAGVAVHTHAAGLRVEGETHATALRFHAGGRAWRIEAPAIALHQGLIPNQQVSRLLRCAHRWDAAQHSFRPVLDDAFATSFPGLYIVGDGGGIAGGKAAALQGRILGLLLAQRAGRGASPRLASLRSDLARELAIRPFLDALYAPDPALLLPGDDVIVCRCEEVTAGTVRAALANGAPGPNQVKSLVRAGMGMCQGRVCGGVVSALIAAARGETPDATDYYRIRPPLKPLPISVLAGYPTIGPEIEAHEP